MGMVFTAEPDSKAACDFTADGKLDLRMDSNPEQGAISLDPFFPPNIKEPYPYFARLRKHHPVYWRRENHFWMLSRYKDVKAALQSPAVFRSCTGPEILKRAEALPVSITSAFEICYKFWFTTVLASDPPEHTAQRFAIMRVFTADVIENMRKAVEGRVNHLLDFMEKEDEADFVSDFAQPLPSGVIFDILGVPEQYHDPIRQMTMWLTRFPEAVLHGDPRMIEEVAARVRWVESILKLILAERRERPTADFISRLVNESDPEARMSDEQIMVQASFLLFAGHETTTNLLSGSLRHLLEEPSLWNELLQHPELLNSATEELLRFVSPVLWTTRMLADDFEIDGIEMQRGSRVQLGLGAANHDPAHFASPDTLDLRRERPASLAFGYGPHYCIGATLARLETTLSLNAILQRLPAISLSTDTFEYQPAYWMRSLKSLPVRLNRAR